MKSYKSKFAYLGQTGLILVLAICITAGLISVPFHISEIPKKETWFLIFASPFILLSLILVWRKISVELNLIEITDTRIIIRNLLTRRTSNIEKCNLKGYIDSFSNGHVVLLVDKSDKVIARISKQYYRNFNELMLKLELKYLEQ